jgi:hypothetical protein
VSWAAIAGSPNVRARDLRLLEATTQWLDAAPDPQQLTARNRLGRLAEAEAVLGKAAHIEGEEAPAAPLFLLAMLSHRAGRPGEARGRLARAIAAMRKECPPPAAPPRAPGASGPRRRGSWAPRPTERRPPARFSGPAVGISRQTRPPLLGGCPGPGTVGISRRSPGPQRYIASTDENSDRRHGPGARCRYYPDQPGPPAGWPSGAGPSVYPTTPVGLMANRPS